MPTPDADRPNGPFTLDCGGWWDRLKLPTAILGRTVLLVIFTVVWFGGGLADLSWRVVTEIAGDVAAFGFVAYLIVAVKVLVGMYRRVLRARTSGVVGAARPVVAAPRSEPDSAGISLLERARHEAVHTVAAWALGHRIIEVHTRRQGHLGGQSVYRISDELASSHVGHYHALVAALAPHVDEIDRGVHHVGSTSDLEAALVRAYTLQAIGRKPDQFRGELSVENLLAHARTDARGIIERHSTQIDALSQRLARFPGSTLLGAEVAQILERTETADRSPTAAAVHYAGD